MRNVLIILGHPSKNSFCKALMDAYEKGAEFSGCVIRKIYVGDLDFKPNLSEGYKDRLTNILEPDLQKAQQDMLWADHLVLVYPTWWGSMPAITKGFIDRVFLPGFAFKHHKGKNFPEKLMKGKSIRILVTMDAPKLWFYLIYGAAQYRMLKQLVFGFVGFSPIRFNTFGFMRKSTLEQRQKWLKKVEDLGKKTK